MNPVGRIGSGLVLLGFLLTGCSGGGANSTPAPTISGSTVSSPTVQLVSGTLTIGGQTTTSSAERKPAYVSAATTHAYIYINGSATPNNTNSACTNGSGTTGTGTFCTISWSANLAVPAAYAFAVETDNGTNVLAEGAATYTIVAGTNTLGTLTLNGAVAHVSFSTTTCSSATTKPGTCNGQAVLQDAAGDTIEYTGATTVPTSGTNPTNGTIFDNGNVTFASSSATNGLVVGTAQTSGSNVFSTFAGNTLTASGVINATGFYTYQVQCATATTTGSFGITVGGGTTPSNLVTVTQLGNEAPVPTYPSSVTVVSTAPGYTCTNGAISSATGTLPVN